MLAFGGTGAAICLLMIHEVEFANQTLTLLTNEEIAFDILTSQFGELQLVQRQDISHQCPSGSTMKLWLIKLNPGVGLQLVLQTCVDHVGFEGKVALFSDQRQIEFRISCIVCPTILEWT